MRYAQPRMLSRPAPSTVKTRTNEELLEAARRCFIRVGFYQTRVEDVVREGGFSRSTFYRHFNSLDEVLAVLAESELELALADAMRHAEAFETLAEQLIAISLQIATRSSKWLQLYGLEQDILRSTNLLYVAAPDYVERAGRIIYPVLEAGLARGELRTDVEFPEVVEWILLNMWYLRYLRRRPDAEGYIRSIISRFVVPAVLTCAANDGCV